MYRRIIVAFSSAAFIISLVFSYLFFSVSADEQPPILLQWTAVNTSANITETGRAPFSEGTTFDNGNTFEFNKFTFDFAGVSSTTFYYAMAFGAWDSDPLHDPTLALLTGTTGSQTNKFTVTGNGVSVSCWIYYGGNNRVDYATPYYISTGTGGYIPGNISTSDSSIVFLFQFTIQPNHDEIINIEWNNPIKVRNSAGEPCYWCCSMLTWKENITDVLYAYIVNMRDSLAYIEYDVDNIWEWLQDHESDIENLGQLPQILAYLSDIDSYLQLMTNNKIWRYRYLSANYQQIIQSGLVSWYDALFHNVENISSRFLLLGQKNFSNWKYTENNDGSITRTEETSSWYTALLTSVKNLDYLVRDADRTIQYQNQVDAASTDQNDNEALSTMLGDLTDANSIGTVTGFGGIFNIAPNDPELLTNQGVSGFLYWFTQQNYDDIQQNEIHGRSAQDLEGWVLPYDDKINRMISDLEGGEDADESD